MRKAGGCAGAGEPAKCQRDGRDDCQSLHTDESAVLENIVSYVVDLYKSRAFEMFWSLSRSNDDAISQLTNPITI